jgi:hypothetical protein
MTFEDLTEEFLHERATKEDVFEVNGTRFSAIYNEGLNVFKLFYVDKNVDPRSEDYEWIEVYFADEEREPTYWDVLRYEDISGGTMTTEQ